ncbi:3-phosphoshikimate 1-carboxyvinyltransferase [Candidatus Carsonella ruddii]|uniref:3-phosphoshikimate 1-carboxyvinyltransferase n=1 Tax=Candidatus Carsonella ruddii HC isolate Thao2000 TaxID=1202538 RepID=J3VPT3_CARRU|nr:3-phosphoshikimate 1-carboxyvinyltransferase [Candidatus Carsonella ruddii]AFP83911.1 3-phosphoshikimate 1-carboxyvinyltransferase [Candidatus Carsonella ruddii HC isolate Thao2000]
MKSYFKKNFFLKKKKKINIGDKSMSHRSILYSLINKKIIEIFNLLESNDVIFTINLCKNLSVNIYGPINNYLVINFLKKKNIINKINFIGNSGTTIRLSLSLILNNSFIIGDKSLNKRTMYRVIKPLCLIGYIIQCKKNFFTPIIIFKKNNFGLKYNLINISSQIKSCLILNSINSFIKIYIKEKKNTRDHTERKIINIKNKNNIFIPNDFSSISFIINYLIINKKILILNFNFNKFRIGYFDFLIKCGIKIYFFKKIIINNEHNVKIILLKLKLKNNVIFSNIISRMIDEIPLLLIFLINYKKITKIYGLEELKYKESNRFINMYNNLLLLGIKIIIKKNYLILKGGIFHNNFIFSKNDHRLFMSFYICKKELKISNLENILSSFPNFIFIFNNKKNSFYVYK